VDFCHIIGGLLVDKVDFCLKSPPKMLKNMFLCREWMDPLFGFLDFWKKIVLRIFYFLDFCKK